jgi:hypothetical protein
MRQMESGGGLWNLTPLISKGDSLTAKEIFAKKAEQAFVGLAPFPQLHRFHMVDMTRAFIIDTHPPPMATIIICILWPRQMC